MRLLAAVCFGWLLGFTSGEMMAHQRQMLEASRSVVPCPAGIISDDGRHCLPFQRPGDFTGGK